MHVLLGFLLILAVNASCNTNCFDSAIKVYKTTDNCLALSYSDPCVGKECCPPIAIGNLQIDTYKQIPKRYMEVWTLVNSIKYRFFNEANNQNLTLSIWGISVPQGGPPTPLCFENQLAKFLASPSKYKFTFKNGACCNSGVLADDV